MEYPFFEIITERPNPALLKNKNTCPYCNSENTTEHNHVTTLVGWIGGEDPNHHTIEASCNDCKQPFTKEYKRSNVWYTATGSGQILRGIPSCFEFYIYTCSKCGGEVHRYHTKLDGETPVTGGLSSGNEKGKWVKRYRTFYKCKGCEVQAEMSEQEYYA